MGTYITAADVRNRLRTLSALKLSDAILESKPMIQLAEAKMKTILNGGSLEYADLTADKKTIADCVAIDICAINVILSAPEEDLEDLGPIKAVKVTSADKTALVEKLKEEIVDNLYLIGVFISPTGCGRISAHDIIHSGYDWLQLDFSAADINLWSS